MRVWRHQRQGKVRLQQGMAASALAALAFAGCADTVVVVQPPTTTVSITAPTTSNPAGPATDAPNVTDLPAPATTTATSNETLPTATEVGASSGQVYLRPVLVDSRFGLPCVVGPNRPAPTSDTGATTTITGLTIDTLPDIPAESSGYMPARGGLVCNVGPAGGTGDVFTNAQATVIVGSGWGVTVTLKPGPAGEAVWNSLASRCFNGDATCPTHQLAIELDGVVISAPTVQVPEFHGEVQIAGDFTEAEARALAEILNRGALP